MSTRRYQFTRRLNAVNGVYNETAVTEAREIFLPEMEELPYDISHLMNGHSGKLLYEMEGRSEGREPLIAFDDIQGWTIELTDDTYGELALTDEVVLWRKVVTKLMYSGQSTASCVRMCPPSPIAIAGAAVLGMWIWGNNVGYLEHPDTPSVSIVINIVDSNDTICEVFMGEVNWRNWFYLRRSMPKELRGLDVLSIHSIDVRRGSNTGNRVLYFGGLYAYEDTKDSLDVVDIDALKLSFPTSENTILPTFKDTVKNRVYEEENSFILEYEAVDDIVQYVYRPDKGTLSDITVRTGGELTFYPLYDGGIAAELNGEIRVPSFWDTEKRLISCEIRDGSIIANWQLGMHQDWFTYEMVFSIRGKSLILDLNVASTKAAALELGYCKGLPDLRLIKVPFLVFEYGENPCIVCGEGVFLSTFVDWYKSNASVLYSNAERLSNASARYNGGARYLPKTDGIRNNLSERLFITVSRDFQEVLPNIDNPKSTKADITVKRVYAPFGAKYYDRVLRRLARFADYGLSEFLLRNHEWLWRDGLESFTLKLQAAPGRGGNEALMHYTKEVKSLGFLHGLYTNYVDFATTSRVWDEDHVAQYPDGNWIPNWVRCYTLKPTKAVQLEVEFASKINDKFGPTASYCDVHTAVSPWRKTDYDWRVPGAGKFATTYKCYGALLQRESQIYEGPVISEGGMHWLYAGLNDGNYGNVLGFTEGDMLLVDFNQLKIRPLQMNYGVFGIHGTRDPVALNIAFGNGALVGIEEYIHGDSERISMGVIRLYYMMQQVQQKYGFVEITDIKYNYNDMLVDTSEAIVTGAAVEGQIYLQYVNGFCAYVNLSEEKTWSVELNGKDYILQPSGFVCGMQGGSDDNFLEFSAIVNETKLEYVSSEKYLYIDTCGKHNTIDGISLNGACRLSDESGKLVLKVFQAEGEIVLDVSVLSIGGADVTSQLTVEVKSYGQCEAGNDVVQVCGSVIKIQHKAKDVVDYIIQTA